MPATKFDKPVFPGAKLVSATVTVTNTSGSYSNTFTDERIATSMRAFQLEIEDPSVFNDKISITTADGSFTIACDEVAGETDVTVGFLKIADDPTAISSTEFTVLSNRIGDLSDLETTDQTSIVNAVNEVVSDVADNTQAIAKIAQRDTLAYTRNTTATTITLESGRKFSDYNYILVCLYSMEPQQVQSSYILPVDLFVALSSLSTSVINVYTNARKYGLYKYVSDTSVELSVNDNVYQVALYGFYKV